MRDRCLKYRFKAKEKLFRVFGKIINNVKNNSIDINIKSKQSIKFQV